MDELESGRVERLHRCRSQMSDQRNLRSADGRIVLEGYLDANGHDEPEGALWRICRYDGVVKQ